jgi:hypothetical protein
MGHYIISYLAFLESREVIYRFGIVAADVGVSYELLMNMYGG